MTALTTNNTAAPITAPQTKGLHLPWACIAPIAVAVLIALIPAPAGLPQYAWYYFAIFVGVIAGLIF